MSRRFYNEWLIGEHLKKNQTGYILFTTKCTSNPYATYSGVSQTSRCSEQKFARKLTKPISEMVFWPEPP